MQSRRRFVEQINRASGARPREFSGEFHALGFAAGHRRCRLPECHVPEADIGERLQNYADFRDVFEQFQRLHDPHRQHVGNRFIVKLHRQRFGVIAAAMARVALDPDIGQEVHFDLLLAHPFAGIAAAALLVEAKSPRVVAAHFGLGEPRIDFANEIENAGVSRWVRRWRIADWVLIDVDHFIDEVESGDLVVGGTDGAGAV